MDCSKGPVELRCLGGFVVTQQYGIGRETSDIDFLAAIKQSPEDDIEGLAGLGSKLHRKYRLYMQHVTIATPPAEYASRMVRMFPSAPWKRLRLFGLAHPRMLRTMTGAGGGRKTMTQSSTAAELQFAMVR